MATDNVTEKAVDGAQSTPSNHVAETASSKESPAPEPTSKVESDAANVTADPASATGVPAPDPFDGLPEAHAKVLREQVETPETKHGIKDIYRYASRLDMLIIVCSSIGSIAAGAALPSMTLLFGGMQGVFQDYLAFQTITFDEFEDQLQMYVLYFVYIAVATFVANYLSTLGFIYTGEHISSKIRQHYLESCLRQNIGFFDKLGSGEVTVKITADITTVQQGISEKFGMMIGTIGTLVAAFLIGFIKSWKLTLIMSSTLIVLVINTGVATAFIIKYSVPGAVSMAQASSLSEEVLSSLRVSTAFGNQERLTKKYDDHLASTQKWGAKTKIAVAGMMSVVMSLIYLMYSLGFWQGSTLLANGELDINDMLVVIMVIMTGVLNVGSVGPSFQAFMESVNTGSRLYDVIDRKSPLDACVEVGDKLSSVEGHIRLENITHIYPSRPELTVMDGVSLDIPAGKLTAIVGASGSGKSTIVGLIERFYNPVEGKVYLDGRDISTLNLRWLRQQMALVGQEPFLFATTIFDNISFGLVGTEFEKENQERRRELVIEAAKKANAHEFISQMSEGYDTNVGQQGFLLSGGQKQRIAIARAIVSNPKILLLDEATAALDTKSEVVIQAALEQSSRGRTTIAIAHRLSTIRDADNIIVMANGKVVEQGTHEQLLEQQGAYHKLILAQQFHETAESVSSEEDQDEVSKEKEEAMRTLSLTKNTGGFADNALARERSTEERRGASSAAAGTELLAEQEPDYSAWTLVKFVFGFNKKEWFPVTLGFVFALICGLVNPVHCVLANVGAPGFSRWEVQDDSDFWSLMYLMLGLVNFLAYLAQGVAFAYCSEILLRGLRRGTLAFLMRQDIGYFDRPENSSGALTAFLALETQQIAGIMGGSLGNILSSITTVIAGVSVSLGVGWKLALVCFSLVPLLMACGALQFWILMRYQNRAGAVYSESAAYATEAITAIRTVVSLTLEDQVSSLYKASLNDQMKKSLKSVAKSSALYAASSSMLYLCLALGFWYGSTLIVRFEYTIFQFFVCLMAIIFGAQSAGNFFSFFPDIAKARHSAAQVKKIFDRQPTIDTWNATGQSVPSIEGNVELRNIHFRYPTRPERPVLRGLDVTVKAGQHAALVGSSGCGKSTTVALLERFYDPLLGKVLVDGQDITGLNINDYRSHIALVNQTPTLYQGTIRDNITMGSQSEVSPENLEAACKDANILDFITSLPEGFDTYVGPGGTLLSGGQKQRIAIARALVRSPKILLLDEATSALDSESEQAVQAALDRAAKGRTTITIAHRLRTIQDADVIYVLDQGVVAESGKHSELMALNGRYAELVGLQSMN